MSRQSLSIASLAVLLIVLGAGGASARPSRDQRNSPRKENPQSKLKRLRKQVQLVNPEALRRSVADLTKRFPAYASKSRAWSSELAKVDSKKRSLQSGGSLADVEKFLAFQRNALIDSNPQIDFDKILFIERRGNIGLTANWQGNDPLDKGRFDNRIAEVSIKDPDAEPRTVFKPSQPMYIGEFDLDWDAKKVMFSTNGTVCEVRLDGSGFRKVVTAINSYDPCYLPDGNILFISNTGYHAVPCVGGRDYVGNIHIADAKGSGIRRLCFDQDNNWHPSVLENGRILFTRWEYTDSAHYFSRVLMHMNPDGTSQREFYGSNSYWPNSIFYARQVPGHATKFVAVISGHHGEKKLGELVLFDAAKGRIEADGAIQRIPGWGKKVKAVTRDHLVRGVYPRFLMPFPIDDKYFLVACEPQRGYGWGIYMVDVFDNMVLLKEIPGAHCLEPFPLKSRKRPPLIAHRVRPGVKEATVYITNVYIGRGLREVPHGTVKQLRLFQYEYSYRNTGGHNVIGYEGPWDVRRMLGTVPVNEDGSALFKIPANVPLAIQPLDEQGRAMAIMRSWFVAMPGEFLSCVGCHEMQSATAARRPTSAARSRPAAIKPWYGQKRGFSFKREVQPVLDRYCAGCHKDPGGKKPCFVDDGKTIGFPTSQNRYSRPYLDLSRYVRRNGPEGDYHTLTPMEFHVSTSQLIQMLEKGHNGVKLSKEAWDRIVTWIDVNVPYFGTWREAQGGRLRGDVIAKRREMRRRYAAVDEDIEAVPNPYRKVAFVKPSAPSKSKPTPVKVTGWPFDAGKAKSMQGGTASQGIDLGGGVKMNLVRIPAGSFVMGDDEGHPDEQPRAKVKISRAFLMGSHEVTNQQYALFDPKHDSGVYDMRWKDQTRRGYFVNQPDKPVIRVSWNRAMEFCKWLSQKTGKRVNLPTEAQWEWACRAGSESPLWYGKVEADFAQHENLADVSLKQLVVTGVNPRPVKNPHQLACFEPAIHSSNDRVLHLAKPGSYKPNPWGLYDIHGNV
ncbi:MAG: HzsA-related protein, partial [Planctomycetota bacterium]